MEWFSYAVAVILLIASIISPIATALINNNHQSKMKRIEIYEISKRNALEKFIDIASRYVNSFSSREKEEYFSALNSLYVYFDTVPDSIGNLLSYNYKDYPNELTKIVQVLSKQIKKI